MQVFLSSTFEDTKNEQDHMLVNVFPFVREDICRPLGLDFDVVTMRWGVNGIASSTHRTSEMCMKQLEDSKQCSVGKSLRHLSRTQIRMVREDLFALPTFVTFAIFAI